MAWSNNKKGIVAGQGLAMAGGALAMTGVGAPLGAALGVIGGLTSLGFKMGGAKKRARELKRFNELSKKPTISNKSLSSATGTQQENDQLLQNSKTADLQADQAQKDGVLGGATQAATGTADVMKEIKDAQKLTSAELAKKTTTEVAKDATTEVAKQAGTEVAKQAGTEVAKQAGTEVAKTATAEVAKTAGTEVSKSAASGASSAVSSGGATAGAALGAAASGAGIIMSGIDMFKTIKSGEDLGKSLKMPDQNPTIKAETGHIEPAKQEVVPVPGQVDPLKIADNSGNVGAPSVADATVPKVGDAVTAGAGAPVSDPNALANATANLDKSMKTQNTINTATGIANAGMAMYGMIEASKDKAIEKIQSPTIKAIADPKLVEDNTEAQRLSATQSVNENIGAAGKEMLENGISPAAVQAMKMNAGNNADVQIAGNLEANRMQVNKENAAITNQHNQAQASVDGQNAQMSAQVNAANANAQAQANQMRSQSFTNNMASLIQSTTNIGTGNYNRSYRKYLMALRDSGQISSADVMKYNMMGQING